MASTGSIVSGGPIKGIFRESFDFAHKSVAHWFPRHMSRSMKKMLGILRNQDCVIEVHDARIPFTGRSPLLRQTLQARPNLLVLNKMDLADSNSQKKEEVEKRLKDSGVTEVLYANCVNGKNINKIVPKAVEMIEDSNRYNRVYKTDYNIMVVGIPNVGKSSLINALRKLYLKKDKNATKVGGTPGITKSVTNVIMVCNKPPTYLRDTPGIMMPTIPDPDVGMKLALCGTLLDHKVGQEVIADYLLFWLNKNGYFGYLEFYEMTEPCDDILKVLHHIAKKLGKTQRSKSFAGVPTTIPNYNAAASHMIKSFRDGKLGRVILDTDKKY